MQLPCRFCPDQTFMLKPPSLIVLYTQFPGVLRFFCSLKLMWISWEAPCTASVIAVTWCNKDSLGNAGHKRKWQKTLHGEGLTGVCLIWLGWGCKVIDGSLDEIWKRGNGNEVFYIENKWVDELVILHDNTLCQLSYQAISFFRIKSGSSKSIQQ